VNPRPAVRAAALVAAAALVGCPLPQPLPAYPDSGRITPPRIDVSSVSFPQTVVLVPTTGCASDPTYQLQAKVIDDTTTEAIDARWFIDYQPKLPAWKPVLEDTIQPPQGQDPTTLQRIRDVPPFQFIAYGSNSMFQPVENQLHVVDLVVSNGFASSSDEPAYPLPYRTPSPNFEVQLYRWVFFYVASGTPGATCPP
jgi:hypothetical protein